MASVICQTIKRSDQQGAMHAAGEGIRPKKKWKRISLVRAKKATAGHGCSKTADSARGWKIDGGTIEAIS
jgi:hypothetical protein